MVGPDLAAAVPVAPEVDPSGSQGYYWTAIGFHTGKTIWQRYAGSGLSYNNNYAGLAIGPTGRLYLGTTAGIVTLRDG